MNSALETLTGDCSKKQKLDESDPLLDEIAKLMHAEEKTNPAIADQQSCKGYPVSLVEQPE